MKTGRAFYRWLLRLCPADLRSQYGDEMEALFLQSLQRARGVAVFRLWIRAIADVIRHGIGARRDVWTQFSKTSAYVEYRAGGWWMDTLRYDLRYAIRAMSRQPSSQSRSQRSAIASATSCSSTQYLASGSIPGSLWFESVMCGSVPLFSCAWVAPSYVEYL